MIEIDPDFEARNDKIARELDELRGFTFFRGEKGNAAAPRAAPRPRPPTTTRTRRTAPSSCDDCGSEGVALDVDDRGRGTCRACAMVKRMRAKHQEASS